MLVLLFLLLPPPLPPELTSSLASPSFRRFPVTPNRTFLDLLCSSAFGPRRPTGNVGAGGHCRPGVSRGLLYSRYNTVGIIVFTFVHISFLLMRQAVRDRLRCHYRCCCVMLRDHRSHRRCPRDVDCFFPRPLCGSSSLAI